MLAGELEREHLFMVGKRMMLATNWSSSRFCRLQKEAIFSRTKCAWFWTWNRRVSVFDLEGNPLPDPGRLDLPSEPLDTPEPAELFDPAPDSTESAEDQEDQVEVDGP